MHSEDSAARGVSLLLASLWIAAGAAVVGGFRLNEALGGRPLHANEYPFELAIYALTAAAVPLIVAITRRTAGSPFAIPINVLAAPTFAFTLLVVHKLLFCRELECMTNMFVAESWVGFWMAGGLARYGVTVGGVILLDSAASLRAREMLNAIHERELAAAEVQLVKTIVRPHEFESLFSSIAARIDTSPAEAEEMITRFGAFLRLKVSALAAESLTLGDDIELARAWASLESVRRASPVCLAVSIAGGLLGLRLDVPVVLGALSGAPDDGASLWTVVAVEDGGTALITVDGSNGEQHQFHVAIEEAA
jgi:hypothetical protein